MPPARTVGQMVMSELHQLDKVAYVRFASVYREFRDLNEFVADLQEPPSTQEDPASLSFPFVAGEVPEGQNANQNAGQPAAAGPAPGPGSGKP